MVNAAVHNAVILSLAAFCVRHTGQIAAAGSGQETACLEKNDTFEIQGIKNFFEFLQKSFFVRLLLSFKIRYLETGAIFQLPELKIHMFPDKIQK